MPAAPASDPLKDLELLVQSRYGVIYLDTVEEDRAAVLLEHLADRLKLAFFTWSCTKGLCRKGAAAEQAVPAQGGPGIDAVYGSTAPGAALQFVEQTHCPAIYHFAGLGQFLDDKIVAARLKDAAEQFSGTAGAVVITGTGVALPESVAALSAVLKLAPPGEEDYRSLAQRILRDLNARAKISVTLSAEDFERLLSNLRGLTLLEAEKILTKTVLEDGGLGSDGVRQVMQAKKAIVDREGLLEYYPVEENLSDIAGLAGLKDWLRKRKEIIAEPAKAASFGLTFPRGILLLGVQGCGKSLCAKAVAQEWALPLLKMDPSNLYNKYIGESERNFTRAVALASQMAPVVLWIDEIEKAFSQSGGEEDGGVSQRILGTFLSWLQDRNGDVFVTATANDISKLPPEFIRKGRFDEIFFVDLPDAAERKGIFEVHLKKRGRDPAGFDLAALVAASAGFSGAEIEQAVVSGLYTAFSQKAALSTPVLLSEIALTHPLYQTMREKIEDLRQWAKGRAVSAQ